MEPASIRYNNPGAMWNNPIATKWGSTQHVVLKDGQANHIAIFPDGLHGAAAMFDLWAQHYVGMSLKAAIDKWSGHNSPQAYVEFLERHAGITIGTQVTKALLSSPIGIKLMVAQAWWEAGKPYPLTGTDWARAQQMVFGNGVEA